MPETKKILYQNGILLDPIIPRYELSTVSSNNITYYKIGKLVISVGAVALNNSIGSISLKYKPTINKEFPAVGIFQDGNIAGYGILKIQANSTTATFKMNTAVTFAYVYATYLTED